MICIPGVTFVDFSATSVTRLISMPGEISTNSDACPAMGRKPCDTVAKNDATCGCKLSRKIYERRSAMIRSFQYFASSPDTASPAASFKILMPLDVRSEEHTSELQS